MTSPSANAVLAGGGEMGALMRAIDWSKTAVGPVEQWPQSLRTALSMLLETGFPMYIAWGREFTQFYNDGYRPILGSTKHPAAMGISTRETFAEIWHIIGPMFEGVLEGRATTVVDFLLPLDRHGFVEECYFIFSYSPIREESGAVGGVLVTVTETTGRVLSERRLKTTQMLAAETLRARTVREVCTIATEVLATNRLDLPFCGIYLLSADSKCATLVNPSAESSRGLPEQLSVEGGPLGAMLAARKPEWIELGERRALALPVVQQGAGQPRAFLLAGTSPRLAFDDSYKSFLELVASQIGTGLAGAQTLEEAQARAESLALLDRAKTTFFSNVSHEFRTPLTLMLGPTEEALASPEQALRGEDLETVHRNALRLLKLVNTLLDFARIEAGRMDVLYEPTDVATLTADLASAFRSAIERAGLRLEVQCPPLSEAVFVDREMWEKIVLNLLSNALKFTFEGAITVVVETRGGNVELRVRDTGTGVHADDVARIFERFQRVDRARARTHEGSGIGLALVKELVALHGGTISASSELGKGTELVVSIPRGSGHLPPERIAPEPRASLAEESRAAVPYVEEALRWLPSRASGPPPSARSTVAPDAARVLVVDDNADMRDYLVRLLSSHYRVEAVGDGALALSIARERRPDAIVSDVMMPGLDGFQLIAALRDDPATRSLPILLLSARAGEEARIDGLQAGADDYLVKPFAARELVARIDSQLVRAKVRSLEEAHALRLASVFAHAPVGVAILRGPEHVFEFANGGYLELVGHRPITGKPVRAALPELAGQGVYELLDEVYASGEPYVGRSVRAHIQRRGEEAQETFFDFVYQPLLDDRGHTSGIAVVCFDVTELTLAQRAAEAANRAKDEFLAMLGHELRNPLAPIVTALSLMRSRNVQGAERERTIIERQVSHLVTLVDDLLDVSRIARGKVQLRRERVEVRELVAKALEMTSPAIEARKHRVELSVPKGIVLDGDAPRLAQVVSNLLTNAAKYSEPGGSIAITASTHDGRATISVKDRGRGIDPEMLPRIFDLFSQERQEIDRSQGGLGLGLAIVQSLVLAHGGTVQARSEGKGRGSEFVLELPLAPDGPLDARAAESDSTEASLGQSLRVLVVDDNDDAAELLAESLRRRGHEVRLAHDGPEALQVAREFRPHAALLDLGLPVMDGFELARELRGEPTPPIAIAAITGYGQEIDRQRTREAGFDAHFVKPVDVAQLVEWLERFGREHSTVMP